VEWPQNGAGARLVAITYVRQCAADDYGHCVVEIRPPHLVFDVDLIAF
jgi:hypothetical protein